MMRKFFCFTDEASCDWVTHCGVLTPALPSKLSLAHRLPPSCGSRVKLFLCLQAPVVFYFFRAQSITEEGKYTIILLERRHLPLWDKLTGKLVPTGIKTQLMFFFVEFFLSNSVRTTTPIVTHLDSFISMVKILVCGPKLSPQLASWLHADCS